MCFRYPTTGPEQNEDPDPAPRPQVPAVHPRADPLRCRDRWPGLRAA